MDISDNYKKRLTNFSHFWTFHRAKRVNGFIPESEVMLFSDVFDMAYFIKHDIQVMTDYIFHDNNDWKSIII